MIYIIAIVNLTSIALILRRGLPQPFPWAASVLLALVLLINGLAPQGGIERGVGFVTMLASIIVTFELMRWHVRVRKLMFALAILLMAFMLADAFRLIRTPDIAMTSGETFGFLRRPYLLEHPNLKACWLLLMTLSPVTLIGIIAAQSRGALLGYITALAAYVTPRRYYVHAIVVCVAVMSIAASIRPGTFFWRADIWNEALTIFRAHPLTGIGTGAYIAHTQTGMATAHNAALTIAAENGLLGLTAFALWLVPAGALVIRSNHIAKYNLVAFAIQQTVDDQWLHPVTAILLGAVIAVCLLKSEKQKNNGAL